MAKLKDTLQQDNITIKTYYSSEWQEYTLKPVIDNKVLHKDTWAYCDDLEDAQGTARALLTHYLRTQS